MNLSPEIKTERLFACRVDDSNKHHVIKLYSNEKNIEFLQGIDVIKDIELTIECYKKFQGIGAYLIFENETGKFIGFGGVQGQEPMNDGSIAMKDHEIEFVIMIDESFAGRGFAYEFCNAFKEKFFTTLPNLSIPARVSPQNIGCIKLLKKLGFKEVGETDYHVYGNKFLLLLLSSNDLL